MFDIPSTLQDYYKALDALLIKCESVGASDIHIATGQPPWFRKDGRLLPIGEELLDYTTVNSFAALLASTAFLQGNENSVGETLVRLRESGSIDGAFSSSCGARYRFNIFLDGAGTAIALRRLDNDFRSLEALGLPANLADFCRCRDGLVVVTGPTGSGKSTTLATLINTINQSLDGHIVTIEDPIEYLHKSSRCLVNQRQVGRDAAGFNEALVESLRQDPDVILVGEVRELETIRTADEQPGVRHQLAMVLRGIFAQHLLRTKDGLGRVPAYELLVSNTAVSNIIATGRSSQLYSAIETGRSSGMCTLDQSLVELVTSGRIDLNTALTVTRNPDSFNKKLSRGSGALSR
jgi:twitching motility protein PilT